VNLRNRRAVLVGLAGIAAGLFVLGILAAYLSRHDKICPDGKAPLAQRSEVLGQTEYMCRNGKIVTK
jgi:hypothetical protein